jgi:ATP-dependent Clp protease ATP-binding subunit ClpA
MTLSTIQSSALPIRVHPSPLPKKSPKSYPQKIRIIHDHTLVAWEKFKSNFTKKTATTLYLEQKLFDDPKKIASILIKTNPFSYDGYLVRQLIKTAESAFVQSVLEETFEETFSTSDSKFKFEKILKFIETDKLSCSVGEKNEVERKLKEMAKWLPEKIEIKQSIPSKIRKTFQVVLRFFPNFMDTVLKAFSLIDAGKQPQTIWDFAAMLEIYYKIFMIPHAIFMVVGAIISIPIQAFLITGAVVVALVIGICIYIKYRPCPTKIPPGENLAEKAKNGELNPVVGREAEIQEVGSYLGRKNEGILTYILLVGEPGVGKSELMKGVAQHYTDKKIYNFWAPSLGGEYSSVLNDIRMMYLAVKGHEDEVVFFIDEIADAIKKNPKANIGGILKDEKVQIVGACTRKEYEEVILKDDSLASRFQPIFIEATTGEQTQAILLKRMETKGKSVRFAEGTAEAVYNLTKDKPQPRPSVMLMDLAINKFCAFDSSKYVSKDLRETKDKIQAMRKEYEAACKLNRDTKEIVIALEELGKVLLEKEKINNETIRTATKIKKLIKAQRVLADKWNKLAKAQPKDKKELIYLNWSLLPWLERKISAAIETIPEEIPMQIDKKYVEGLAKKIVKIME